MLWLASFPLLRVRICGLAAITISTLATTLSLDRIASMVAGGSGYYVYNVTDLANPELLLTILGVPGVSWGHTFTPSPDGRFAVGETEFQYQPLRFFDLQPALDGEVDKH